MNPSTISFTAVSLALLIPAPDVGAGSWREMKRNPNANFYDILAAHEAERAAAPKALAADGNPDLFEELEDRDYKFERWRDYAEVRVEPSGDLSLLSGANEEMRKWMGLEGRGSPVNNGAWTFLGPNGNPVGKAFTGIPNGNGRLNFIRFHPMEKDFFLVGSPGGGLWISRNAGASWSPTTDKISVLGVADVAVDPKNPDILYIATGDRDGGDSRSVGVLKSRDGGKTWDTTGLSWKVADNKEGGRLLIHPVNTDILLHGGSDGVYRSTDGGATFTRTTGITDLVRSMEFKPGDPNTVYAAGKSVYYSSNGGVSWQAATGPTTLSSSRIVLAVSPAEPASIWAYTAASNLHVSTNSGRSFAFVGVGAAPKQSGYNLSVAVSPIDADQIVTGQVTMKRSQDGGRTWTDFQTGAHWDIHGLEFLPGSNTLFAACDGGLYRSINGGAWTPMNTDLQVSEMYRVGVSRSDPTRVCNGYQDNGTTLLMPGSQTRIGGADGFECFFDHENPNTIYIESQNGGHSRCTWSGTSATCSGVSGGLSGSGSWNTAWGIDPKVPTTIYTTRGATLYKSTARGSGWAALSPLGGTGTIREFAVAPSNTQIIYAILGTAVYRSSNGGSSWQSRSTGLSGSPTYIAVNPGDPDDVWISISGYTSGRKAYHSENGGLSWVNASEGLPNLPANTLVFEEGGAGGVYIGMDVGVFYRNLSHTSWQSFFQGLPNVSVRELEIGGKGSAARLNAATYGRGAWQSPLWGQTSVALKEKAGNGSEVTLSDFKATQREPGGYLDVQFHLSAKGRGRVVVELVSVRGKVVFRQEAPGTGFFSRRIDLSGIGKGTFLLRIRGTAAFRTLHVL